MVKVTDINAAREAEMKERERKIGEGLRILGTVALVAGTYGYRLGHKRGYKKGVGVGYEHAIGNLVNAWQEHAGELRELNRREGREGL